MRRILNIQVGDRYGDTILDVLAGRTKTHRGLRFERIVS